MALHLSKRVTALKLWNHLKRKISPLFHIMWYPLLALHTPFHVLTDFCYDRQAGWASCYLGYRSVNPKSLHLQYWMNSLEQRRSQRIIARALQSVRGIMQSDKTCSLVIHEATQDMKPAPKISALNGLRNIHIQRSATNFHQELILN